MPNLPITRPLFRLRRAWPISNLPHKRVALVPHGDGWELRTAGGLVLFRAAGEHARRACMAYASEAGIPALAS